MGKLGGFCDNLKKLADKSCGVEITKKKKNLGMLWMHKIYADTNLFLHRHKVSVFNIKLMLVFHYLIILLSVIILPYNLSPS